MISKEERSRRRRIAKALKKAREKMGVMQSHIAQLIGVDCPTLWRMERGEAGPWDDATLSKWMKAVGVESV